MTHGTEKRARAAHLTFRLTKEERAAVDAAAERAGLTAGSFARQAMLGAPAPRQVRRPPVERKELARLLGELGKIGSNLNQIARAVNTGVFTDSAGLVQALADLKPVRDALLRLLRRAP